MRIELAREGVKAQIVIINDNRANNSEDRQELIDRTQLPIFQDTAYKSVWTSLVAGKDDMLIYDGAGKLLQYIKHKGAVPNDLGTPEGYNAVKSALVAAAQAAANPAGG